MLNFMSVCLQINGLIPLNKPKSFIKLEKRRNGEDGELSLPLGNEYPSPLIINTHSQEFITL